MLIAKFLLAVIGVGVVALIMVLGDNFLRHRRRWMRTCDVEPCVGQWWYDFGDELFIVAITPSSVRYRVYVDASGDGPGGWVYHYETLADWRENVDNRWRFLMEEGEAKHDRRRSADEN